MSARDALSNALWDNYTVAKKNAFIDAFVHELAEQQRAAAKAEFDRNIYIDELSMKFTGNVIDLIDPEAEHPVTDFQDRGDTARQAQGIDGTAGDAQDIRHRFVRDDDTGSCLLCGLAETYRKHIDRILDCGLCYEEDGEEVHPHPECPISTPDMAQEAAS